MSWWSVKKIRLWISVVAAIPVAVAKGFAVNACSTTSKASNCPVAASRRKRKKPTIAVLKHFLRRGIFNVEMHHKGLYRIYYFR
jgi:hypothetical protein